MFGYHVPAPDQALLISGGKPHGDIPFRVVKGRGAFVMPLFRKANMLSLATNEAKVEDNCVTHQGITLKVSAVIAFKVGNDDASIVNAGQRFLSLQDRMNATASEIFAGHLRSIVGSLTVEEIIRDRNKLAEQVLENSKLEMGRMGLMVDSMQIKAISDGDQGYIKSLAAPHISSAKRDADVAQSETSRASAQAEQASQQAQAQYAKETAIVRASMKADTDKAQAEANQAGPLAQAEAQRAVLQAEAQLAIEQADLTEKRLYSEIIKPAEAEARRIEIIAEAEAEAMKKRSEAAASHNAIALQQEIIEQMPEIIRSASQGLNGANLTILDGQEGVNKFVTGMVAQGIAVISALKDGTDTDTPSADGENQKELENS